MATTRRGIRGSNCYSIRAPLEMERGMERAHRHTRDSHRQTADEDGDDSESAVGGARSASSLTCTSQLPRWPDRVRRQSNARKGLEVPEHSAGTIRRL